jgi:alpha 1,3-glucosidase
LAIALVGLAVFIKEYFFWIKFRSCETTSFCRRYREWKRLDSRPTISVDSVSSLKYESTSLIAEATLKLKSEVEAAPHYGLTVTLYRNQASVRMRIDDISPERPRERYRIPAGDIIIDHPNVDTAELKPVKMESENGVTTFSVPGMYKVAIVHSDFVVRMYNKDGVLVQVLNSRNYFTFEKYRKSRTEFCPRGTEMDMACHPRVDAAESWAETFTTFVDEKPFGPSAVGLDISFVNSRAVFGIPVYNKPQTDRI